jgi:hypothetical protein
MFRFVCSARRGLFSVAVVLITLATAAHAASVPEFYTLERIRFGETLSSPDEAPAIAWSFDAVAGAEIELKLEGAGAIQLRGPKRLGGNWNTIWKPKLATDGKLRFAVPRSGRYGVFVKHTTESTVRISLSCHSASCEQPTWSQRLPDTSVAIIAVGDTGLQPHKAQHDPFGGYKYEEFHLYTEMIEGFERFLDAGDINIVNVETAVTGARKATPKKYNFRMHPNGLLTLVRAGFDVFAMANNHAGDYGTAGLLDSLGALTKAKGLQADINYAGIGKNRNEAITPAVFTRSGVRIAYASVGFGFSHQPKGPYMATLADVPAVLVAMRATGADLKILSAHFGSERALIPGRDPQKFARDAIDGGIDLFHGHHPHVVQGIERRGDGVILYSVGNFLLRGARNMGTLNRDMDYGAAVRLGFDRNNKRLHTLEVVPVYDMHRVVFPLKPEAARQRIGRLNVRSRALGTAGLQLNIDPVSGFGFANF